MQRAIRIQVRGRVQGVGFRFFVVLAAERLGLRGYARNLADGSVEVVAAGTADRLAEFLGELSQGPRGARVDELQRTDLDTVPAFASFEIRA